MRTDDKRTIRPVELLQTIEEAWRNRDAPVAVDFCRVPSDEHDVSYCQAQLCASAYVVCHRGASISKCRMSVDCTIRIISPGRACGSGGSPVRGGGTGKARGGSTRGGRAWAQEGVDGICYRVSTRRSVSRALHVGPRPWAQSRVFLCCAVARW